MVLVGTVRSWISIWLSTRASRVPALAGHRSFHTLSACPRKSERTSHSFEAVSVRSCVRCRSGRHRNCYCCSSSQTPRLLAQQIGHLTMEFSRGAGGAKRRVRRRLERVVGCHPRTASAILCHDSRDPLKLHPGGAAAAAAMNGTPMDAMRDLALEPSAATTARGSKAS